MLALSFMHYIIFLIIFGTDIFTFSRHQRFAPVFHSTSVTTRFRFQLDLCVFVFFIFCSEKMCTDAFLKASIYCM